MSSPLRILQVVPSLNHSAGVARFVYNMQVNSDSARVHYDFLHHAMINGKPLVRSTFDKEMQEKGSSVYSVNYASNNFQLFLKQVDEFFDRHGNEYDIVHCHMPNSAFRVLADAKRAGVQNRILHSHLNNSSDNFLHRVRNYPLNAIGKRYATGRLACSEDAGKFLFGKQPFQVIRNGIEIEQFEYDEEARKLLRADLNIKETDPVIGCVGRIVKQKNYLFAIAVFIPFLMDHPNAKLVFVGDGTDRSELEKVIKAKKLQKSVMLLGVRDDINKLYSVMDVFFMPSLYEGLPVSAVEAQAAGLPCVYSTDVPRETNITETGVFVDRVDELSRWTRALEESAERGRQQQGSKLLADRGYSARENAKLLMDYYERIVENN